MSREKIAVSEGVDIGRRVLFLRAAGVLSLAALAACSTAGSRVRPGSTGRDETGAVLSSINALRTERGLSTLSRDPAAVAAALDQAVRMAQAGRMEHNIGLGADFLKRMQTMQVALPAAENIAAGQETPARAFDAWVRSQRHLRNMLGTSYTGLGVAVATDPASGGRPYWAMVLSRG